MQQCSYVSHQNNYLLRNVVVINYIDFSMYLILNTSASYPMGTGGSFLGDKAAGTWSWTHLSVMLRLRMRGSLPPFTH